MKKILEMTTWKSFCTLLTIELVALLLLLIEKIKQNKTMIPENSEKIIKQWLLGTNILQKKCKQ